MTTTAPAEFDRLVNFRDLGGLRVAGGGTTRHGVLFRSESTEHASVADDTHLREVIGLHTIVDLRQPGASARRGPLGVQVEGAPIDYVSVPCADVGVTPDTRHVYYTGLLEQYGPEFADLVRRAAAPGTMPMLVHCQLGCDRTGTVVAMLLRLAGVLEEDICADYARSIGAAPAIRFRSEAVRRSLGLEPLDDAFYGSWANRAEIMAETLDLVEAQWGGMHGWAHTHGLTQADVAGLRAVLVEPN